MQAVLLAVQLLQVIDHRTGANQSQDDVRRSPFQGIHEELDVLFRCDAPDVDHQESIFDAEGESFSLLCDLVLRQVDSEGLAIHHRAPLLREDFLIAYTGQIEESFGLFGNAEEAGPSQSPISVAPLHAVGGGSRVEPPKCPPQHTRKGRELVVAGRDLHDVRVHRADHGHVADEAGCEEDLQGRLLRGVHEVRPHAAEELHEVHEVSDGVLHADVLAVDRSPLGFDGDVFHDARHGLKGRWGNALPTGRKVGGHQDHLAASFHEFANVRHHSDRDPIDLTRKPRMGVDQDSSRHISDVAIALPY
mmetsp:Transcript_88723/g.185524  ORF Transcript_88723/g.185524 Transcript_88723/m.185524 type:complete len:305 (-) Transcript_88723:220-1134(-)